MVTTTSLQPIKIWHHTSGPNPWKIIMTCKELSIPYKAEMIEFPDMKKEPFLSINPNGRVPAIQDPNTGMVLWESAAIMEYLTTTYDKSHLISYLHGTKEGFLQSQWLYFQMSGQGPYYGQAAWFGNFHPEQLPSAIERYQKEVERVVGVIDLHLSRTGSQYLVGDKFTIADLAFVPWANNITWLLKGRDIFEGGKYPAYKAWFDRVLARPAVAETLKEKADSAARK